ncbi:MAG TPA: HEAT repeat domain-containing protein, partial [Planctomycetota bacterium]|nr:HEAT repeat domain-containing protein [Planctomycetota bacterium]
AAICAATKSKLPSLTEEQTETLERLVEEEKSTDVSEDLTDILFHILLDASSPDDDMRRNAVKVLVGLVMMHVKGPSFKAAADVLGRLRALAADDELSKDSRVHIVEQLQSLGDEQQMGVIVETLKDHDDISQTELARFLMMLPATAAPALCEVMELQRYDKVVRVALKHLVKDDPTVLTSRLLGSNIDVAVKVLGILEQVAEPGVAQALVEPLTAAETPVKKASVTLLEQLGNAPARDLLLEYVTSEDPGLRKAALKSLTRFRGIAGPATPLRQQLAFKDFHDRTLEEKKALLVTLARLESHHAIDLLVDILDRSKWFERSNHAETRACAALALGVLDDDRAREALDRHLGDKSQVVRTAAGLAHKASEQTTTTAGS